MFVSYNAGLPQNAFGFGRVLHIYLIKLNIYLINKIKLKMQCVYNDKYSTNVLICKLSEINLNTLFFHLYLDTGCSGCY